MTQAAEEILKKYKALADSDRAELSEIIADESAIRSDVEYLSAWSQEIRSRLSEHESGMEPGIPWEQLREQLMREDGLGA
jgi:putative addiction module component (TIGR02574 family)